MHDQETDLGVERAHLTETIWMTTSSAIVDHFHAISLAPCAGGLCPCDVWQRGCGTRHTSAHTLPFSLNLQAYELMYSLFSMLIPTFSDLVETATDGLLESVEVSGVFGGFSCCNCTDC